MLVDSHAHLQLKTFNKDRDRVIIHAKKQGVKYVVNVGFDVEASRKAVELAEKHDGLYATVGVHPHNAVQFNQNVLNKLKRLSTNRKVVAIGEVGLDYYRNLSPRQSQKEAFEAQLMLAEDLKLPVVIHDREAHADILKMLSKFRGKINGVMHCFSGSKEMAEQCVQLGFSISFAGPITFPNSHKLREVAKRIDLSNVLLETDSPWLTPLNATERRNEPAHLVLIARETARLKQISFAEVTEATTQNAMRIFNLR